MDSDVESKINKKVEKGNGKSTIPNILPILSE